MSLLYLLVSKLCKFRAKNNRYWTIVHKISTSTTSLIRCVKDGSIREIGKAGHDFWFFFHGSIHYINMNQSIVRPALISLKSIFLNVEIFSTFEVRSEVANTLVTRDNVLHRKRIYLQKNESSIFKPDVKVFRNGLYIVLKGQSCKLYINKYMIA